MRKILPFLVFVFAISLTGVAQDIFKPVTDGDLEKVRILLKKDEALVHKRTRAGKTPVHFAAEKGHTEILTLLLSHGGLVDDGNVNGTTPLHYACFNSHLPCVRLLVEKGADVNKSNKQSLTALSYAVLKNSLEVAEFLVDKGAIVDVEDREGGILLHTAAQKGNLKMCQLLIKNGASPTKEDNFQRGAIFFAAQGGNQELLMILAAKGADIKKADRYGKTPLYNALARGHVEVSLWLLGQKLPVKNFRTKDGSTYLHAAAESGKLQLVKLMLSRGVKDDTDNRYGESPFKIARKNQKKNIIALLNAHGLGKTRKEELTPGPYLGQKLPGMVPVIFAPGLVTTKNTTDRDICFTGDLKTLYFTQDWKIKKTKQEEKGWSIPKNVFPGKYLEAEGFLSPDETRLFFLSRMPAGRSTAPATWEVWISEKSKESWGMPRLLGDPFKGCFYTTFTREYIMYYTGRGNDIYYSRFHNGSFGKPKKLGHSINTAKAEYNSFIDPDETYLIYSSIGMEDHYGGGDLYISFRDKNGTWCPAVNMGSAVNTSAHEYCPSVSPGGKYFFFSSTRLGNKDDVYWMDAAIINQLKQKINKGN